MLNGYSRGLVIRSLRSEIFLRRIIWAMRVKYSLHFTAKTPPVLGMSCQRAPEFNSENVSKRGVGSKTESVPKVFVPV
jgi:hypothetical protein